MLLIVSVQIPAAPDPLSVSKNPTATLRFFFTLLEFMAASLKKFRHFWSNPAFIFIDLSVFPLEGFEVL